jgi:hypothetical protein
MVAFWAHDPKDLVRFQARPLYIDGESPLQVSKIFGDVSWRCSLNSKAIGF